MDYLLTNGRLRLHPASAPRYQRLISRESEILQCLVNRAIAQKMTVTHNIIKAHTRRLYAKLHVNNRT